LARAPRLEGLYGRQVKLANGDTLTADDDYIRESILNPTAKLVAGWDPVMPTFQGQVSEEQVIQLIAYVKSLADAGVTGGTEAGGGTNAVPVTGSPRPAETQAPQR
jgi:cytochrome c oxidase subunit 2